MKIPGNLTHSSYFTKTQTVAVKSDNHALFVDNNASLSLAIAQEKSSVDSAQFIEAAKVNEFIKQFLPVNEKSSVLLNKLINNLTELNNNKTLSNELKVIVKNIIEKIPDRDLLTNGNTLKQVLEVSGLFLESELVEQSSQTAILASISVEDYKANLLRLISVLKQELKDCERQTIRKTDIELLSGIQSKAEKNLAKITLDQLLSLPNADDTTQIWRVDIPFLDRQQTATVSLNIQKHSGQPKSDSQNSWSVKISLELVALGSINCTILYQDGSISACFKSNRLQTVQLIEQQLDQLKTQFEKAGLLTNHLVAVGDQNNLLPVSRNCDFSLLDEQV